MNWFFFLLISLFFSSCDTKRVDLIPYSEKERISDEILYRTAVKLRDEKSLIACGTGGGMMGQIEMLALSFDYHKPVTIQEGRALLINAVETLLAEINTDESIRPYLQNYPFNPTNVEIRIFLQNADGSDFGQRELSYLAAYDGTLIYRGYLSKNRSENLQKETYEEGLRELERYR